MNRIKNNIIKMILPITLVPMISISCGSNDYELMKNVEVHDGDTFKVDGEDVRLLGTDTPEITRGEYFVETGDIERLYAEKARIFAEQYINTHQTRIERIKKGKYGRTIAIIHSGETTLSIQLLKAGLARVAYISNEHTGGKYKNAPDYFYDDPDYIKRLYLAQEEAILNKAGVWSRMHLFNKIFPKQT